MIKTPMNNRWENKQNTSLSGPKGRPLLMAAAGSACAGCTVGVDVRQGKCRGSNGRVLRQRVSGAWEDAVAGDDMMYSALINSTAVQVVCFQNVRTRSAQPNSSASDASRALSRVKNIRVCHRGWCPCRRTAVTLRIDIKPSGRHLNSQRWLRQRVSGAWEDALSSAA
jgi:hypothetical protein